ncbi:T9SS type A sorting domain-containing protein [Aestuariivivens insulae]|uniref:T9SS type A sorting domain-containing protein n=1 Tax=Aestuariivivens insulae TaxID=1621988 RepID=UPI001F58D10F|nr:T9SS type A sorting domain-containing protein [Aestuariivivens insulae]
MKKITLILTLCLIASFFANAQTFDMDYVDKTDFDTEWDWGGGVTPSFSGGILTMTADGSKTTPNIRYIGPETSPGSGVYSGFDTSGVDKMDITFKNNSNAKEFRFYFPKASGGNSYHNIKDLQTNETEFKTYTIDLSGDPEWTGVKDVLNFRFQDRTVDPFPNITGTMEIDQIVFYSTLSVKNNLEQFSFNFYPNPVDTDLKLSSARPIKHIAIYNILGAQVLDKSLSLNKESIDISGLRSGIYLMKVQIEDAIGTYKIVKK